MLARRNHFVGALSVSAAILAAVGMLVDKVKPAQAQDYLRSGADLKRRI
jgi:hypothetical protein